MTCVRTSLYAYSPAQSNQLLRVSALTSFDTCPERQQDQKTRIIVPNDGQYDVSSGRE